MIINWPRNEVERIAARLANTDKVAVLETGYGPSGLPHIGTFAEVVRTTYVIKALHYAYPERAVKLIVFSDDMDGLRSLPENIPNHKLIQDYLGAPLSSLPDPFEQEESYAAFMNRRLQHFLDHYGFEYLFESATRCYQAGIFNHALQRVMDNYDAIRKLFLKTISPEKRDSWSPFFPICEQCGKIYTTTVTAIHPESYELSYRCDRDEKLYHSCGHEGRISILNGKVKTGWKVDWAMRWYAFGVDYEMHGKDLLDSATLSSKICSILGANPPLTYKYELFLDENGAKISKKIGNGISMEQWQECSPVGALLYFLLDEPNRARKMGMPILPRIIDNYLTALRTESNAPNSPLWFVDSLQHHHDIAHLGKSDVSYALLVNVAQNLGLNDPNLLYDYLQRYDPSVMESADFFHDLCNRVLAYIQYPQTSVPEIQLPPLPAGDYLTAWNNLAVEVEALIQNNSFHSEALQTLIFSVGRKHGLEPNNWFRFLYEKLLGKVQGPRLGSFFAILGPDKVRAMLLNPG